MALLEAVYGPGVVPRSVRCCEGVDGGEPSSVWIDPEDRTAIARTTSISRTVEDTAEHSQFPSGIATIAPRELVEYRIPASIRIYPEYRPHV